MRRCRMTSTLSNDISYEATGPFKPKFYLWHPLAGGFEVCVFNENCLLSLVAMAAQSSQRLMMGNIEKWHLLPSYCRQLDDSFIEMFLK